jgi:tryptophan synthase alpha chain
MAYASPTISPELDPLGPRFAALRAAHRRALIPYITAGYPTPAATSDVLQALVGSGADIVELGVPFSDPVADGPTIQRSSFAALEQGVTLQSTLEMLSAFTARNDTPVVLFSYLNPVLGYGAGRFIRDAAAAGAAGVLLTDLPVGGDAELEGAFQASPLSFIRLVAPTTPQVRLLEIAASAQGFLYYVGSMGVTGARAALRRDTLREVAALRARTSVPVAVGFGVSTPQQAADLARAADGVIVGSALIDALDAGGMAGAGALLAGMRAAMDAVGAGG